MQVALCQCTYFTDRVSFRVGNRIDSNLLAFGEYLNINNTADRSLEAFVAPGSYFLSPLCPYHNSGSLCSDRCRKEIELADPSDPSKVLKNPQVGLRICPEARNDPNPSSRVTCYLDIDPCQPVRGLGEFLIFLGSTWGWVSMTLILFIIIANSATFCYARSSGLREEPNVPMLHLEDELEMKVGERLDNKVNNTIQRSSFTPSTKSENKQSSKLEKLQKRLEELEKRLGASTKSENVVDDDSDEM